MLFVEPSAKQYSNMNSICFGNALKICSFYGNFFLRNLLAVAIQVYLVPIIDGKRLYHFKLTIYHIEGRRLAVAFQASLYQRIIKELRISSLRFTKMTISK